MPADDMGVPLSRTRSGLITVPVTIGDETYTFLLDTGSTTTVVSERIARDAKLKTYAGVRMTGSTGVKDARQAWLPELRIGQLTISNHWIVIADLPRVDPPVGGVDGILGTDVLSKGKMRLDIAQGRLWLLP